MKNKNYFKYLIKKRIGHQKLSFSLIADVYLSIILIIKHRERK